MHTMWREKTSSETSARAKNRTAGTSHGHRPTRIAARGRRFCSRHRVAIALLAVPAVLVVASGAFAAACWFRVQRVPVNFPGSAPGGTTYLLVGSDSRAYGQSAADRRAFGTVADSPGQHADVIVLVRVPSTGSPRVLSVPRDLLVRLPDGAPVRITQSFDLGAQTLVDTVCHSLGVGVSHLMVIHLDGLQDLVNDVGGITISVPTAERDLVTGLALTHAGRNQLDGAQALAYVRARHLQLLEDGRWVAAPNATDERSGRATEVLSLVGERLEIGPQHPLGSAHLIWELSGLVTVDSATNPFNLDQIGSALRQLHDAHADQLPVLLHNGYVPTAELEPGGSKVLEGFGGGAEACSTSLPIVSGSDRS